jgi:hypothetical protein
MDIAEIRNRCQVWRRRHKMFIHDIRRIENSIEKHITNYSNYMVLHRQTHKQHYIDKAEQEEIEIKKLIDFVEKIELMSLLSRR